MKRFPSTFNLNPVTGSDMIPRFDKCIRECEVEDEYKQFYRDVTPKIRTIKRSIPNSRAECDGVMEWDIIFNGKLHTFYTIQETKFRKSKSLLNQLAQALHYSYLLEKENSEYNIEAFILNSENYFGVIYKEDIMHKLGSLHQRFSLINTSPSGIYSEVSDLMINFKDDVKNMSTINKKFKLHNFVKEIYKRCVK